MLYYLFVTVQDIVFQLQRLVTGMSRYHNDCHAVLKDAQVFPIEVDLSRSTFTYEYANQFNDGAEDDDSPSEGQEGVGGVEAEEAREISGPPQHSTNSSVFDGNLINTD